MALAISGGVVFTGGVVVENTGVDITNLNYDVLLSGGYFNVAGNTVTTTGQFASVLYRLIQTTGKIYLEFTHVSDTGYGYASYFGLQRAPTQVGNYHNGTTGNGNGGAGIAFNPLTPTGSTYGILVDLDAQTVSVSGGSPQAIPGSGQLYFAVYDGTSSGTGSAVLNWGMTNFVYSVPPGAIPAGTVGF